MAVPSSVGEAIIAAAPNVKNALRPFYRTASFTTAAVRFRRYLIIAHRANGFTQARQYCGGRVLFCRDGIAGQPAARLAPQHQ